jgi:16S rRNA processing protein RimM
MHISDCYKIGYVLKPHGLQGEVTLSIDIEAPDLNTIQTVFIDQGNGMVPYFIEKLSLNGAKAFVKFEDVNSLEEAAKISKSAVFLPKSSRPKSVRGEFYDDEIIGFEVHDEQAGLVGTVQGVTQAGMNKLLAIDSRGKEVLIPLNSPFIMSINKGKKRIRVSLPEGFLDI